MYNLLIVDDEKIIRQGIMRSINKEVLDIDEVYEAENGLKALDMVKEMKIDLILADINMPKMNGLDFAKEVKAFNKNIKIALVTGYDYFEYAVNALRVGVDEYILKPVSKSDIEKTIKKLIDIDMDNSKNIELQLLKQENESTQLSQEGYKIEIEKIIEEKLHDSSFSLTILADIIGLSSGYLSRLFKKYYNISFREYILQEKIRKAKILLISSDMKIYEISEDIGFEDPNYFTAMFKRETGYTPNGYKKHVGKK